MNDGGPAFPRTTTIHAPGTPGMSLRAWLAGQALAGYRASCPDSSYEDVAKWSAKDADALIAELQKPTPEP